MPWTWILNKATNQWRCVDAQFGPVVDLGDDEEVAYDPNIAPGPTAALPPANVNETVEQYIASLRDTFAVQRSEWETKDSGAREVMETGSQRDTREGKGRFELISPFALARLAGVYERGAKKYDARNWEKGQPFTRLLDSALRHLNRFAMGWTDEDHLSQALWNVAAIIHFQELGRKDLDDMPHYQDGPKGAP